MQRVTGIGGNISFAIPSGSEAEACRELLACLANGDEVCLRNDLDEGNEGCTFFRRSGKGFVTKVGGHGWQGDWRSIDEAGIRTAIVELAPFNRGGHWSNEGSLSPHKPWWRFW